jgi:hypothetical protein
MRITVTAQVLFDRPQHEIASLLRALITRCAKTSLVAGVMRVERIEAIAAPLRMNPSKLAHHVVGAGTWRAFDALDRLLAAGVLKQNEIRQHGEYRTARLVLATWDQLTADGTLATWSTPA